MVKSFHFEKNVMIEKVQKYNKEFQEQTSLLKERFDIL